MKGLMISAPNSNSGKTVISASLISVLKDSGLDIGGFKTGPDQIDRKILEYASGKSAGNLDRFMMGSAGLKYALGILESDYCIIEGVMGCFDGIASTAQNSSFEIAQDLNINILLAYTPSGEMFTMIPKLKGMLDFSADRIKGIILNKIKPALYPAYKKMIEENLDLPVLGFLPPLSELKIKEAGLGLAIDTRFSEKKIRNFINKTVLENFDIKKIMRLFKKVKTAQPSTVKKADIKTGIAMDKAFSLYYSENIFLFKTYTDAHYFSPLKDKTLSACDILYFGSGNIKEHEEKLSSNKKLKTEIKKFAENGGIIFAEGESVNYLFEYFDDLPMCGVFKGNTHSSPALQNFGYKIMELKEDSVIGKKGDTFYAAEYHKSKAESASSGIFKITKPLSDYTFEDGFAFKNTLAVFQNINFISCLKNFSFLLNYAVKKKRGKL